MNRKRLAWAGGAALLLAAALALAGFLTVRSAWFYGQVRERIVQTVETATGGRAEAGSFTFDWRTLRAELKNFTLHGTEPAGKPALFRADSIAVGLKILSAFRRKVDVQFVEVAAPRVYLIVYPDGRTNVPEPKVKRRGRTVAETILDLAVDRFNLRNGIFEIESGARVPFQARGRNLNAQFGYEAGAPRYRGRLAMDPLELDIPPYPTTPIGLDVQLAIEKNRVQIESATLKTGDSQAQISGAVEDFRSPHGSFQYEAQVSQGDLGRFLRQKLLDSGTFQAAGNALWNGGRDFSAKGNLRAWGMDYSSRYVRLRAFRADGAYTAGPAGVDVSGLRFSGQYARDSKRVPVDGRVANVAIRGKNLDGKGIGVASLGGTFRGNGVLQNLERFRVEGEIEGFQARRVVAVYSSETLPWDGRASGPLLLEGAIRARDLRVSADLAISPEQGSAPVHGRVMASFDARTRILDLGRSKLELPSSHAEFSGAIGRRLNVHLETRDLNDILPAVGLKRTNFPVTLQNGAAIFDGQVTGSLDDARVTGLLNATRFSYSGRAFDSLTGQVTASPANVRLDGATLTRGSMRAQFQAAVALRNWKAEKDSAIYITGALRNAPVQELAALAEQRNIRVSGTVNATGQVSGWVSKPVVEAEIEALKGEAYGEPFDRAAAHVSYSGDHVEIASGRIAAGAKQVDVRATYQPSGNSFDTGRLRYHVATNAMPLDQIATLEKARPGISGTVQGTASGTLDLNPAAPGGRGFQVIDLQADVTARSLKLTGQPLGDARLTAQSKGNVLTANLLSDFANSLLSGHGEWRLEGDYPGDAIIAFSRLDFGQLRAWIAPSRTGGPPSFTGFAEGELHLSGPMLKPEALKAELRIPKLELGPAPGTLPASAAPFTLRNEGPVLISVANSVVTVANARLQGRSTDLTVSGKASINQKNPLDLRVGGRVDLGILSDFNPDLSASGGLVGNATIRGTFSSPQVGGQVEVQNAALSLADFPNGLSNANGAITFTGDRATIEKLSGESGGGKIEVTGYAGLGRNRMVSLRIDAHEVRVRYPEGVSTVANAGLTLTGTAERSTLAGLVTVLRTGFNPQSDFSSILAQSAEPVRTPPARTGFLAGLNLDVQIQTDPDIRVQSSITQDIGLEANLRLKGTATNPVLLGRVNITQGQVLFFGTRYTISQGSVAFFNPVKIEPNVNVDLETKFKAVDVTLTISGPLGKMTLTPRSDPPLHVNEIMNLLATGTNPTSDPTTLARQTTQPQSFQQTGASALLGQAIASPVAGRLQRFFGVSRLRIDPTLPGVQYNPQARITLEQQITRQITFTYITVVNSSNPQIVSMEWDVSPQWSVVAVREENGAFGLDFYYKRRFK